MNKQKTGIFSGSFNPIHIGHLALANYLCEYEGLDEIWFMVSPQNPLKAQDEKSLLSISYLNKAFFRNSSTLSANKSGLKFLDCLFTKN